MDRRSTLELLVRWYPEAVGAGGGNAGGEWIGGGPGSKLLTYGPLYYDAERTWRELERCFAILREDSRSAHLFGRYWCPPGREVGNREVRFVRSGRDKLDPILPSHSEVMKIGGATSSKLLVSCSVHFWPSWVMQAEVDKQLEKLSGLFRGSPFLPISLLDAA